MQILRNERNKAGIAEFGGDASVWPSTDADRVSRLLERCPAHGTTPLIDSVELAELLDVGNVAIKDERERMGLGSFKALGAAYVIARDAENALANGQQKPLAGKVYVAASAGNHGLSIAAGAQIFGAKAVIYLSESVPEAFADRLKAFGAETRRKGSTYEESMAAARSAADEHGWILLADSSWPGYLDIPRGVMEGYLQIMAELASQMPDSPTHIFLQAGVGGLAASVSAMARQIWGDKTRIVVVEPEVAPALIESIRAGRLVETHGPVSSMGRLDCKVPSLIALNGLSRDADFFATISEKEAAQGVNALASLGFETTPSGGAGLAGALAGCRSHRKSLVIGSESRILVILTEGPESE